MDEDWPEQFPYVRACPECAGRGYQYYWRHVEVWGSGDPVRVLDHRAKCTRCEGRGGIIPEEWTNG